MAQFKIVVSDPKTGKSEVLEAKDSTAQLIFIGEAGSATRSTSTPSVWPTKSR